MVTYNSTFDYIDTETELRAKITKINAVILALEALLLSSIGNENIKEYWLDDGQTKIKTEYRGAVDIIASLTALDTLKYRYINQLQGRVVTMVDEKNFRGR
jgi:hypothetical protein|tara:strand:- start:45 stop:347 length:303 start_codon:yes stop_codon:yes gene_type:complete